MDEKQTLKYVRFLIENEVKKTLSNPEAPKDAEFGQYLFAPQREDAPKEENTNLEEKFLIALKKHYNGEGDGESELEEIFPKAWEAVQNGQYLEMLKPPNESVYRSVGKFKLLSPEQVADRLGISVDQIIKSANKVTVTPGGVYNPYQTISSWTVESNAEYVENFIATFASWTHNRLTVKVPKNKVVVIMKAEPNTSGKFLLNPYNIKEKTKRNISAYVPEEMEVVGYGPIKITKAVFYYNSKYPSANYENLFDDMFKAIK